MVIMMIKNMIQKPRAALNEIMLRLFSILSLWDHVLMFNYCVIDVCAQICVN